MTRTIAVALAAVLFAGSASAQVVDGTLDASYGPAKSNVAYLPGAPTNNFGAPTQFSDASAYSIYLTSDANFVYGFLQSDRPGVGPFANLYFDLNNAASGGSDLGFEITNGRAFIPGVGGYSAGTAATPLAGLSFATSADGLGVEFSIANNLFTGPIAGLDYSGFAGPFPTVGGTVQLRLSQSFGYSVAGGATYGANRLGVVTLGGNATPAVPEPATWAMMLLGFGAVGFMLRRRPSQVRVRYA